MDCCEHRHVPLGAKEACFLEQVSNDQPIKTDYAAQGWLRCDDVFSPDRNTTM